MSSPCRCPSSTGRVRAIPPFDGPSWPTTSLRSPAQAGTQRRRAGAQLHQTPDIFHTFADIVGDSLALAREAARTDADVIVLAGVHFMARPPSS